VVPANLLADVRSLIEQARDATARAVNSALVLLYWSIGDRIRRDILREKRAEYGEQIVTALSAQLAAEYGKGFTDDNLFRMMQLAEVFPDREIVGALSRQLGWSHFLLLLPMKDELKRDFYAEMCRVERWSVRTLRQKINGLLVEDNASQYCVRTAPCGIHVVSRSLSLPRGGGARTVNPRFERSRL
jgi:DUF1016 N-terminal domain